MAGTLYLMRHGETTFNLQQRSQGWCDSPLTERGREQATRAAARIRELGMNPEDYWWYCDLRRYGSCRHAGFGLGFERMVMYLTGIGNIRDVELHPRTVGNADF